MKSSPDTRGDERGHSGEPGEEARPAQHREAFWSVVVGVPAVLSILRLWVEAGGELQTTLLLVSHVGPLNLVAAFVATATQLVTVVLVALFTACGVLRAAVRAAPPASRLRTHHPILVRLQKVTPPWFMVATFLLAVLTWKIFYLPLLLPALAATFQRAPWDIHDLRWVWVPTCLTLLIGYYWLVSGAVQDAWAGGERIIAVLLVAPPLIALLVTGPTPEWFARSFSTVSMLAIVPLAVLVAVVSVKTPVLPLVVTEIDSPTGTQVIRGHIVDTSDLHLIMLEERGGIRYIDADTVGNTVLCGTPAEVPAFTTRVHDFHVEDSLLTAIGRLVRPHTRIDPLCRIDLPE